MLRLLMHRLAPALAVVLVALLASGATLTGLPGEPEMQEHLAETESTAGSEARLEPAPAASGPVRSDPSDAPPTVAPPGRSTPFGAFWEENRGQWAPEVLWMMRGSQTVALTTEGLVLPVEGEEPIRMTFVDGSPEGVEVATAKSSTTTVVGGGIDVSGARHAERLRMPGIWPGIDFDVYVNDAGNLEFDFRVHPGADPADARLVVRGADPSLDDGALVLGPYRFAPPHSFQGASKGEDEVPSAFVLDGPEVRVAVDGHDPSRLLVIDPELAYGTLIATPSSSTYDWVSASTATPDAVYFAGTMAGSGWAHPDGTQAPVGTGGASSAYFVHMDDAHNLVAFVQLRTSSSWGNVWLHDMDVDEKGRVFLAGTTSGGIPTVGGYSSASSPNPWAARFVPSGSPVQYDMDFSTHLNSVGGWWAWGLGVVANDDGTFWVAGRVEGHNVYKAPTTVIHPSAGNSFYRDNVFATLWSNDAAPSHLVTSIIGSDDQDYPSRFEADELGDLYFVGTSSESWPVLPTTPDALYPSPIGGQRDHFYGKILQDGTHAHLSYWGSPGTEPLLFGADPHLSGPGPAIEVLGPDEIVIVGTAATCCVELSPSRPQAGSSGGYDAYVSHIDIAQKQVVFSTHLGGTSTDYGTAVDYDPATGTYFVGGEAFGQPVLPDLVFPEPMPKPERNKFYDGFITVLDPGAVSAAKPPDQQEGMVSYTMYVGPTHDWDRRTYVREIELTETRFLQVAGSQFSTLPGFQAPTTEDAVDEFQDNDNNYDGFFQRYELLKPLVLHATDGVKSATSPGSLQTLTMTDVLVHATVNMSQLPDADLTSIVWDLDQDTEFADGFGTGPFLVRRDDEALVNVCARLMDPGPDLKAVDVCMNIFFENRPPIISLNLMHEPEGFLDPLPFYHVGQPVWYDAGFTNDPEGDLDFTKLRWVAEVRDGNGTWVPDPSISIGGDASLGAKAVYDEPGQKRMSLFVEDILGAKAQAAIAVMILADPPVVECAFGGPVRMDRWIDVDVVTTTTASPIKNWTLDPGMGLPEMNGNGVPPFRIRTYDDLPAIGDGTMVLTVRDEAGSATTCALDYVAGPHQVTADFGWDAPVMPGQRVAFEDRSTNLAGQPVRSWEWRVDGLRVSTDQDPEITFAHAGIHQVTLRVSDGLAVDTYTQPVEVLPDTLGPRAQIGVPDGPFHSEQDITLRDVSVPGATPIEKRDWTVSGHEMPPAESITFRLPSGEHDIGLTVTDQAGKTSTRIVRLEVASSGGVVPEFTVSQLAPGVGQRVGFVDVSRTGAKAIVDYEWQFSDGSRAAHGRSVEHVFWQPGMYDVQLTLHEHGGVRHHVTHTVTVVEPAPGEEGGPVGREAAVPVAEAGFDRRVLAGTVVLLDAGASRSAQSSGMTATWTQVGGPVVELVPQGNDASLRVPFALGEILSLRLVVADANGVSQPDIVRLHIVDKHADGIGQVAAPATGFTIERTGTTVRLTAPAHAIGAEYVWDMGDGTTRTGQSIVHEYTGHGIYPVQLTVRDVHDQESVATQQVEVRSSDDLTPQQIHSARPTIFGHSIATLVIAGLAVAASATVATLVVRKR